MKIKGFITISILILLIFPLVSAVEFDLKENFQQGETLITRVSGNFVTQIARENVFFYREHVRIPVDWGMAKISDEYYIYAVLSGKEQGNYSVSIENVKYMEGTKVIEQDIVKNFTITNETADFSLNPGVVVASDDFFVEVQNLKNKQIVINVRTPISNNSERDILVSSGTTAKEMSVSVKSGEIKKIYFELGTGNPSLQFIELKTENLSYELPVYVSAASSESEAEFRLEPAELISSIPTNSVAKRTIYFYNTGSREIRNISFSLSGGIKPFASISGSYIGELGANSNFPVELSFLSPGEIEVSGTLKANINGESMLYSQISLKFLDDYIPVNESQQSSVKTCSELGGKICSSNEKCSQQVIYAKDNVCCPGTCQPIEKSSAGTIIAILIFVVIAAGLFWFYKKKYKKARKSVDLLKEAKGKKLVSFWAGK